MTTNDDVFSKILATFFGVAVGDALGMPVETWTAEQIKAKFGLITNYLDPANHPWFRGFKAGTTTDDYQLTEEFAKSFIARKCFDMDDIAKRFAKSFMKRNVGWGGNAQRAAMKIALGGSWQLSGRTKNKPNTGGGNGVAMKIAPLAVHAFLSDVGLNKNYDMRDKYFAQATDLAIMTHDTVLGVSSAWAQFAAILFCLEYDGRDGGNEQIFGNDFLTTIFHWSKKAEETFPDNQLPRPWELLSGRMALLQFLFQSGQLSKEKLIAEFGGGSCFIPHSLPFTYGFFVMNPRKISSLYDVVSAGGDTDTNGSMLASLLGALNGVDIFPEHLIRELFNKIEVDLLATRFFETFSKK